MRGNTSRLGAFLRDVLNSHPAFSANPLGDWKELAGDQVARHCRPKSLKEGLLVLVASDAVWKHHMELHKEILREKINAGREKPLVEKIAIRIGEVPEVEAAINPGHQLLDRLKAKKQRTRRQRAKLRPLTPEEEALLAAIPDKELRKIGSRLLRRTTPPEIPLELDRG